MVFCNTKQSCRELEQALQKSGLCAKAIHGDLEQRERDEALILFSNGSLSILVATDVAARGLDIKDLQMVINFELSFDPEQHVHRIGRTGRAGKKGQAISFFSGQEKNKLDAIEQYQTIEACLKNQADIIVSEHPQSLLPTMATLRIGSGRKYKLRPGDILGALTAPNALSKDDIGKIDIFDMRSFVAIASDKYDHAFRLLSEGTIKGRHYKVSKLEATQESKRFCRNKDSENEFAPRADSD